MPALYSFRNGISKFAIVFVALFAFATASSTPQVARAGGDDVVKGAIAVGIFCLASGACGGKKAKKKGKGGQGGDAVHLTDEQERQIQEGLAAEGFYSGSIDGSLGKGTRAAIRDWQAAKGYKVTGYLLGGQINELIRLSVAYAALPDDDLRIFAGEAARDLDKDGLRKLQAALNAKGYNAGPVDGSWGKKTRLAVEAYKRDEGIPGGSLPTMRLLAHLEGNGYFDDRRIAKKPEAGVAEEGADAGQGNAVAVAVAEADDPVIDLVVAKEPEVAPATALHFEIAGGLRLGMVADDIRDVAEDELETEFHVSTGTADQIGGDEVFSLGVSMTSPTWPDPGSEQIVAVFDEALPEYGALAIFRSVILPEGFTQEKFEKHVLPGLLETFGSEGQVGNQLIWIGDGATREAAKIAETAIEPCGAVKVGAIDFETPGAEMGWDDGKGPRLDSEALASVVANCGDVLHVAFDGRALNFALWDSDVITNRRAEIAPEEVAADVPEIKF